MCSVLLLMKYYKHHGKTSIISHYYYCCIRDIYIYIYADTITLSTYISICQRQRQTSTAGCLRSSHFSPSLFYDTFPKHERNETRQTDGICLFFLKKHGDTRWHYFRSSFYPVRAFGLASKQTNFCRRWQIILTVRIIFPQFFFFFLIEYNRKDEKHAYTHRESYAWSQSPVSILFYLLLCNTNSSKL